MLFAFFHLFRGGGGMRGALAPRGGGFGGAPGGGRGAANAGGGWGEVPDRQPQQAPAPEQFHTGGGGDYEYVSHLPVIFSEFFFLE